VPADRYGTRVLRFVAMTGRRVGETARLGPILEVLGPSESLYASDTAT
jgi:hypothetical protein